MSTPAPSTVPVPSRRTALRPLAALAVPALVVLAVLGSTDWVDGYVARRLGQVSRVGMILDPLADRLALIIVAVALVAVVTAAAGPIAFVALAAPQIGRRIARAHGTSLLASAAVGALLLVGADLIAQHALGDIQLPVGVVTVSIVGLYLIWLLIQEARKAQ